MKKVLIIGEEVESDDEIYKFIDEGTIAIPLGFRMQQLMSEKKAAFNDYNSYYDSVDQDSISRKSFDFIFRLPDKKINGKTFKERICYNGMCLWWALRKPLFYLAFNSMKNLEFFREVLKKESPDTIIFYGNDSGLLKIIETASRQESKIEGKTEIKFVRNRKRNDGSKYFETAKAYCAAILRFIQGYFRYRKFKSSKNRNKMLILTNSFYWQLSRDASTGRKIKTDVHFDGIIKLAEENGTEVIVIDLPKNRKNSYESFKEKKYPYVPWEYFLFSGFLDRKTRKKASEARKILKASWDFFCSNEEFRSILKVEGLDIFDVNKTKLSSYFNNSMDSLISFCRNVEIARTIIKDCKIKACLLTDELGSGLHFVYASKIERIKSFGLQHGNFGDSAPTYKYKKNEINSKDLLSCQIPDKIFVYGNFFRKKLINGNYPEKNISVAGSPRADIVFHKDRVYKRKEFLDRYGINSKKKIVLLATSGHYNMKEIIPMASEVYKTASELGFVLIHKPHPGRTENMGNYKELKKKFMTDALILLEDVDLYDAINASDIVVSSIGSTIITEALMFEKPAIAMSLSGNADSHRYKKLGIASIVEKKGELKNIIVEITAKKEKIPAIAENKRKKFLSDTIGRIDGKTNGRIYSEIKKVFD